MRSVFQLCTWPLEVRCCAHSQKDNHGELHFILCIFNSPTLRLSWIQVRSAQRGEKLTSESVWTLVSTVFMWPGARRDQGYKLSEYQVLETNGFPKEVWHAPASSLLHRNGLKGLWVPDGVGLRGLEEEEVIA